MKNAKAFAIAIGIVVVLIAIMMLLSPTGYALTPSSTQKVGGTAIYCPTYDKDKDGTYSGDPNATCRPRDCNNNDAKISPLMPEIAGDNIDNDCDGAIDEEFMEIGSYHSNAIAYNWVEFKAIAKSLQQPDFLFGRDPNTLCISNGWKGAFAVTYKTAIYYFEDDTKCAGVAKRRDYIIDRQQLGPRVTGYKIQDTGQPCGKPFYLGTSNPAPSLAYPYGGSTLVKAWDIVIDCYR